MKNRVVNSDFINKSVALLILINPILDLVVSLTKRFTESSFSIATIFRGGTFALSFLFIALYIGYNYKNKINDEKFRILLGIFITTIVSMFFFLITRPEDFTFSNYMIEINEKIRMLYFPYIFIVLFVIDDFFPLSVKSMSKSMKITLFVYSFLIVFPFITKTDFNSYSNNDLSGTVGWLFGANEIGLILGILINIYLLDFINDNLNVYDYIGLFMAIFSIVLIGTKGSLLMLLVFSLLIAYRYLKRLSGKQWLFAVMILLGMVAVMIVILPAGRNILFLISTKGINRFFTTMLSGRITFLSISWGRYLDAPLPLKMAGIGVQFLNTNNVYRHAKMIEMDFFEVFIMHGVMMVPIVFSPYIYTLSNTVILLKDATHLSFKRIIIGVTLFSTFILSFLVGHIVGAPSVSIYVVFWMLLLKEDTNSKENKKGC